MFGLGMTELLVILAIVLLVFGPKRLKSIGSDLGSAIKGFRSAVSEEDKAEDKDPQGKVIDGEPQTTQTAAAKEEHKTQ
ncbi:MAG: sec-independent protein translocase protein TatA [Candidatus Azotimanducaceae bacterium]|jgi:sec-independent protein translocase protein TatA|tara:strand:- start:3168 stop:3404 length:237 start_codon:yes stop_codon:yes gene_type:complete